MKANTKLKPLTCRSKGQCTSHTTLFTSGAINSSVPRGMLSCWYPLESQMLVPKSASFTCCPVASIRIFAPVQTVEEILQQNLQLLKSCFYSSQLN